jgi:hypothetical protein
VSKWIPNGEGWGRGATDHSLLVGPNDTPGVGGWLWGIWGPGHRIRVSASGRLTLEDYAVPDHHGVEPTSAEAMAAADAALVALGGEE